jgi:Ser/Thr protein kinase RdoA (MazF antagonist)
MEEILLNIRKNYDICNAKIGDILQSREGRVVATLLSENKKYVVKVTDTFKSKDKIERDVCVFSFLKQNGFTNTPEIIKTQSNQSYIAIGNKFAYILEYIDGRNPKSTIKNWSALGELIAELHRLDNYPNKTSFTFENEKPKLIENADKYPFREKYLKLVNNLPNFDALPQSLIHTDIGLHNSIQNEDGFIILIDWDDCGVGTRVLDLGFPLISQFLNSDLVFEKEKAGAFYRAYVGKNSITLKEKKVLFDAGLFFSLLYLPYGNLKRNWEKIEYAIENRNLIERVFD